MTFDTCVSARLLLMNLHVSLSSIFGFFIFVIFHQGIKIEHRLAADVPCWYCIPASIAHLLSVSSTDLMYESLVFDGQAHEKR